MSEKSFNCSQCNMPIYPPQVPGRQEFKDKFDQIKCLGCGHINNYFQSRKIVQSEEKVKPKWELNFAGIFLKYGLIFGLIVSILEWSLEISPMFSLILLFIFVLLVCGYLIYSRFFKNN